MNPKHLIILLCFSLCFGEELTILDSLTNVFDHPDIIKLDLTISQKQYDQTYVDHAYIEFETEDRYSLVSSAQTIWVDHETIYTFTSESNQVVIENVYPEDFSLLSILTGNFTHLTIKGIEQHSNDKKVINYYISNLEAAGKIVVDKQYRPVSIYLEYDKNNTVEINIMAFNIIETPSKSDWTVDGWEVIDLRE